MQLLEIIANLPDAQVRGEDLDITGLSFDSRTVAPGELFICITGTNSDGHDYAKEAVTRGAVAVLAEHFLDLPPTIAQICVADSRRSMAVIARQFYNFPDKNLGLIGVTGTDGKTTTATLITSILMSSHHSPGLISTVTQRVGITDVLNLEHQTTLSSLESQQLLANMVDQGNDWAVIEASSHGLDTGRLEGFEFDVAVFTRITSEHLDHHLTIPAYVAAKSVLLNLVLNSNKPLHKWAILPAEDDHLKALKSHSTGLNILTYGQTPNADVMATDVKESLTGISFLAETPWGITEIESPLMGRFNVDNCLAAIATAGALDISLEDCSKGIGACSGIIGRMQLIDVGQSFKIIVDYAHTAASLRQVLESLRSYSAGRLFLVFGGAGERDKQKRSDMGAVAARHCDYFVVSDEDPRSESQDLIALDILAGALKSRADTPHKVIHNRRDAIRHVLENAQAGDTVLLSGKGHENSIIGPRGPTPWDEAGVTIALLKDLGC